MLLGPGSGAAGRLAGHGGRLGGAGRVLPDPLLAGRLAAHSRHLTRPTFPGSFYKKEAESCCSPLLFLIWVPLTPTPPADETVPAPPRPPYWARR